MAKCHLPQEEHPLIFTKRDTAEEVIYPRSFQALMLACSTPPCMKKKSSLAILSKLLLYSEKCRF